MANSSKTRTGSAVLRTVTALVSRTRLVTAAIAASTTAGRRDRDIETMMLADAEDVETGLVGELRRGEHLAVALRDGDRAAGLPVGVMSPNV